MSPPKCPECEEKIYRNWRYLQCALCSHYYHQPCTDATENHHKVFASAERVGFRWMCPQCSDGFDSSKVLREISKQVDDLASSMPQVPAAQNTTAVKQFSAIVREAIEKKDALPHAVDRVPDRMPKKSEVLIVKPADGAKESLVGEISATLKNVKVKSCRKRQDGSVVLNFPTKESKEAASAKLSSSIQGVVAQPKKLMPKITVVGVPKDMPDDRLIQNIRQKNDEIDSLMKKGHQMEVCFTKPRSSDKSAILRVSPNIRAAINEMQGFIYLEFTRCKVYDRFYVTQCYHYQKFNHIAVLQTVL